MTIETFCKKTGWPLGLDPRFGHTTFTSTNKREVELWISGATAVMNALRSWSRSDTEDES